jgi:hypothetical protein
MTKNIKNIFLSGVALAVSAQAGQVANIQFPFRTTNAELPAGRYQVEALHLGSGKYLELRNLDTGKRVMFHPSSPVVSVRASEKPRLIFACGEQSGCSLQRIWSSAVDGFDIYQKKSSPAAEAERLAVVQIEAERAE